MISRDELGRRRYGVRLNPFNGRNPLQDLYEELMDACAYIKQEMVEREAIAAAPATPDLRKLLERCHEYVDDSMGPDRDLSCPICGGALGSHTADCRGLLLLAEIEAAALAAPSPAPAWTTAAPAVPGWSQKPPETPGWYWWRRPTYSTARPVKIELSLNYGRLTQDGDHTYIDIPIGEWCGPISLPPGPTEDATS